MGFTPHWNRYEHRRTCCGYAHLSQNAPLFKSASLIGGITFLCVILAYSLSKTLTKIPTRILEISAGCILIALGLKVLIEHTLIN